LLRSSVPTQARDREITSSRNMVCTTPKNPVRLVHEVDALLVAANSSRAAASAPHPAELLLQREEHIAKAAHVAR